MAWIKMIPYSKSNDMPPFDLSLFSIENAYGGGTHSISLSNNAILVNVTSWAWGNQYYCDLVYNQVLNVSSVNTIRFNGKRTIDTSTDFGYASITLLAEYSTDGVTFNDSDQILIGGYNWTDNKTFTYQYDLDVSQKTYVKFTMKYGQLTSDQNNNKSVSYYLDGVTFI